ELESHPPIIPDQPCKAGACREACDLISSNVRSRLDHREIVENCVLCFQCLLPRHDPVALIRPQCRRGVAALPMALLISKLGLMAAGIGTVLMFMFACYWNAPGRQGHGRSGRC